MTAIARFERLNAPAPIPTAISQPFWDAAARHELALQRCAQCDQWIFYPRTHCPHCWSDRLLWDLASGKGRLKTFSIVHKPGHPAWATAAPYALGIIALSEGPSMLSTLLAPDLGSLHVGMPLRVRLVSIGAFTLPMFEPRPEQTP